jgi:hypothetical protein
VKNNKTDWKVENCRKKNSKKIDSKYFEIIKRLQIINPKISGTLIGPRPNGTHL